MADEQDAPEPEALTATQLQLASAEVVAQAAELRRRTRLALQRFEAARRQVEQVKARLESLR